ncbi:MAG: T9SS type A sorting domain-containing protein [Bacteroidia bacterium]
MKQLLFIVATLAFLTITAPNLLGQSEKGKALLKGTLSSSPDLELVSRQLYIYPNPATDHFIVKGDFSKYCQDGGECLDVWVISQAGETIVEMTTGVEQNYLYFNTEEWPVGYYYIRIRSRENPEISFSSRFFVEK